MHTGDTFILNYFPDLIWSKNHLLNQAKPVTNILKMQYKIKNI